MSLRAQGQRDEAIELETMFAQALGRTKVVRHEVLTDGHGQSTHGENPKLILDLSIGVRGLFKSDFQEWRREITAYRFAKLFPFAGFEIPVTIPFNYKGRDGSLQVYVPAVRTVGTKRDFLGWWGMQIFDFIIGNGDRHDANALYKKVEGTSYNTLIGIDHGFAVQTDGQNHWRVIPHTFFEGLKDRALYDVIKQATDEQIFENLSIYRTTREKLFHDIRSRKNRVLEEMRYWQSGPTIVETLRWLRAEQIDRNESTVRQLFPDPSSFEERFTSGYRDGDKIVFKGVDFSNARSLTFKLAPHSEGKGGTVIAYAGPANRKIAEVRVRPSSKGSFAWQEITVPIVAEVAGVNDLQLVFWNRFHAHPHDTQPAILDFAWLKLNRVNFACLRH